jgi:hypothetical protein
MLAFASLVQVKEGVFRFRLCRKRNTFPPFLRAKRAKTYSKLISMMYLFLISRRKKINTAIGRAEK